MVCTLRNSCVWSVKSALVFNESFCILIPLYLRESPSEVNYAHTCGKVSAAVQAVRTRRIGSHREQLFLYNVKKTALGGLSFLEKVFF